MPLLALWAANAAAVAELNIEQIVATAGDGRLRDGTKASTELREYLAQVSSEKLAEYATHCSSSAFQKNGLVLQDIVNELGRRLDYSVDNGRYQGVVGAVGADGVWHGPDGADIVVEVKTTDTYRISLDTIAGYREQLRKAEKVSPTTSILIVVGREDTGELEAQVRGSRHAWDIRLISVDALFSLVRLKESTESGVTGAKIRSVLSPMEYTRLDPLIDVMFTAAKDVEATAGSQVPEADIGGESGGSGWVFTDASALDAKRAQIFAALGARDGKKLIRRSRALFWDASHTYRAACTVSKRYERKGLPYWYAFHPAWDDFLGQGEIGYLALGCMDLDIAFVLPLAEVRSHLGELNISVRPDRSEYWHVKILEPTPGVFALQLPKSGKQLPLEKFALRY